MSINFENGFICKAFDLYFTKDRFHYQEFTSGSENANYLTVQLTELKNVSISKWHFVLSFFRYISRTLTSTGKVLSRFYYILRKTRTEIQKSWIYKTKGKCQPFKIGFPPRFFVWYEQWAFAEYLQTIRVKYWYD